MRWNQSSSWKKASSLEDHFGGNYRLRQLYWYIVDLLRHCKQDPFHVFVEMKPLGLVPNFHIHVSVSDLYIPTIGTPILLQPNKRTDHGNI